MSDNGRPDAIRWTATVSVAVVAVIGAYISYGHMRALAAGHGEAGLSATLLPLSVDGLIVAASMVMLADSRAGRRGDWFAWLWLIVASGASLAANVLHGEATLPGRVMAAWPPLALIAGYELLLRMIRRARTVTPSDSVSDTATPDATSVAEPVAAPTPDVVPVAPVALAVASTDSDSDDVATLRHRVRQAVSGGATCPKVAATFGLNQRRVERWTKDIRATAVATTATTNQEGATC